MNRITPIKKIFGLSMINLLLLQPVLLCSSIARAETKAHSKRIKNKKAHVVAKAMPGKPIVAKPVIIEPEIENPADLRKAHEAQQARNEQARSVLGRKEEKNSFAKKIDAYVVKTKTEFGHKDISGKVIAAVLDKIKGSDPLIDVKKIIDPINKRVAGQEGEKLAVQEQLGLALLLKASLPLGQQAFSITCEMLHKLDNYISYWRDQKHHPMSHFFHKNPKKWFVGNKQKVEIEENLKKLVAPRDVHLGLLYKLAEHESLFDQNASMQDQYKWLARYLELISNICYNVQVKLDGVVKDEVIRFEKMLALVNDMLGRASFHESNVDRYLAEAKKPGHFTRNWIAYTGLAIGSSLFAWHAYKNQQKFSNWFYNDVHQGAINFGTSVYNNGRDLYHAFIGKGEASEQRDFDTVQREFDQQLDEAQHNLEGVRDALRAAELDIRTRVDRHYPVAQEQNRQEEARQASIAAIANYLEGRDVLVRNNTLLPVQEHASEARQAHDNNAAPQPVNRAAAQLREISRGTNIPAANELKHEERALLFGAALERIIERDAPQFAQEYLAEPASILRGEQNRPREDVIREQKQQVLAGILRESLTQAIADIQNATAPLQSVKGSSAYLKVQQVVDVASEVANKVPQLGGAVALIGHVAAIVRATTQDASNGIGGFGGIGADVVGNLAQFMNTLAGTIGQVPRQRIVDGRAERVMEPGPLRAGMASGIDLAKKADQLIKQNQATFILAALIPAGVLVGGTCFGANKLYKALKHKPDFKPIREALIDIGHLLNEEGLVKKIEDEQLDQGRILYLVWKLKREADNVPALQRDQFLADVNRLGKSDLDNGRRIWTAEKKLRIIDLMYRTYDFLNPAYVTQ